MARVKKLKLKDINKNSAIEKKYTINKIKKQELKYTIILVSVFMLIFTFLGYKLLAFNENDLKVSIKKNTLESFGFNSPVVLLTKNNIFDEINSKCYILKIDNKKNKNLKYQILFVSDDENKQICGCKNINNFTIKYSVNNKVKVLDNSLIVNEGVVSANSLEEILIKIGFDKNSFLTENSHFHGHFVIEEIKD